MKKKKYIKPAYICETVSTLNAFAAASIELKTTNGQASDSYEILSKDAAWHDDEDDY